MCKDGTLTVIAESDFNPVYIPVSIDGMDYGLDPDVDPFVVEFNGFNYIGRGEWELEIPVADLVPGARCSDIIKRRVSVQTNEGGNDNTKIRKRKPLAPALFCELFVNALMRFL